MQVHIRIQSKQKRAEFSEEPTLQTQEVFGVLTATETGFTLAYTEPDDSVGGSVLLTYTKQNNKIMLERTTIARTLMVFTEGVSTFCDYYTPFGKIPMHIRAEKVSAFLQESSCGIFLEYRLEGSGLDPMEIRFSLFAKQAQKEF